MDGIGICTIHFVPFPSFHFISLPIVSYSNLCNIFGVFGSHLIQCMMTLFHLNFIFYILLFTFYICLDLFISFIRFALCLPLDFGFRIFGLDFYPYLLYLQWFGGAFLLSSASVQLDAKKLTWPSFTLSSQIRITRRYSNEFWSFLLYLVFFLFLL